MKTENPEKSEMHGVCVVDAGGAPYTKPHKVKVLVQKRGWWWRCVPLVACKQVVAFTFPWEKYCMSTCKTYISLPAPLDMGRLQEARRRSGDAVVKMVMTHTGGKVVTLTTVENFLRRLAWKEAEEVVLHLSIDDGHSKEPPEQEAQNDTCENSEHKEMEASEAPWVGKTCKCPRCVLPFWELLRAWEPLPVKPPTVMDTYVGNLLAEGTVLKTETKMLEKDRKSCVSQLAALNAETAFMEQEMDRVEASWASDVMEEGQGELSLELGGTEEEGYGSRNEEEWMELLDHYTEEEEKTCEEYLTPDEGDVNWQVKEYEEEGVEEQAAENSEEWRRHGANPSMLRALSLLHNATR
ncbi:uncharacterized protein LOC135093268 [Scylla paramamosain]|uniref:uncharacterized protein LOC135093268 n=1 Tax=Scylla paramamosain TaxID=85552 RepID=UPI0030828B2A